MLYTVFFKEANKVFKATDFIREQPFGHRELLNAMADELSAKGTITDRRATKNSKGEWSILLKDHDDVYVYTVFISLFEREQKSNRNRAEAKQRKGVLVIVDPAGPRDSIGGYHPGYWFVEQYVDFLEENQKTLFLQVVQQINTGVKSDGYTINSDGSVAIHIRREGKSSTVSLTCRGEWV